MIKHLVATTVFVLAGAAAGHAADLAYRKAPPMVAAVPYTWSGFYIGANAGYGFGGDGDVHTEGQAAPNIANINGGARPGLVSLDRNGALGGGQIGYNYQFGSWVTGIEADIAATDFRSTRDIGTAQLNTGIALNNRYSSQIDYLGTVRGRIGYAFDRTLVYGTGGLAYGETKQRVDMFGPAAGGGLTQFTGEQSKTNVGYTVGAGVEYAFANNLSFKTEYLYYNLGKETLNVAVVPGNGGAGTGYNSHFENDGHIVRVGLNYKIN